MWKIWTSLDSLAVWQSPSRERSHGKGNSSSQLLLDGISPVQVESWDGKLTWEFTSSNEQIKVIKDESWFEWNASRCITHHMNEIMFSIQYTYSNQQEKNTYTNARWSIKHLIQFFFYFTSSEIFSSYFHIFSHHPSSPTSRASPWHLWKGHSVDQCRMTSERLKTFAAKNAPNLRSYVQKKRAVNLGKNSKIFIKIISVWGKKKHRTKNNLHMILVGLWEVLIQQSEVQEIEF